MASGCLCGARRLYLNIVLGRVNVSLFTSKEKYACHAARASERDARRRSSRASTCVVRRARRFAYKQHYEHFKLAVTMISLALATAIYLLHAFGLLRPTPLGPDGWPLRTGTRLVGPHISRVVDALFHFLCVWCALECRRQTRALTQRAHVLVQYPYFVCLLQVLLHAHHPREHPARQRLQVSAVRGEARRLAHASLLLLSRYPSRALLSFV